MKKVNFDFVTNTSTLCVFDLACLKHRLDDDCDWWSIPSDELLEVNSGNVAFIGLGNDGTFTVEIVEKIIRPKLKINLKIPSRQVFIGSGEEVTGDEMEPNCTRGGSFITLKSGNFILSAQMKENIITLAFEAGSERENNFDDLLRLSE